MEALEIEGQTDQAPLESLGQFPAQGELAEAQHLLDDAEHRFDGAFACPGDRFAQRGLELVRHLDLGTRVLRWWIEQWREPLLPAGMMGITARRDVRLDATLLTRHQGGGAKIPSIQCRRLRHTNRRGNISEGRFGFLRVVGMIGEGPSYDEQTPLIHGHLRVVILLKACICRIFHDARLRVGKVVLVAVTGSWHRRSRWAATWATPCRAPSLRTLRQLGLIVRLLGCPALLGTSLPHRLA